ncbi:MAG TPA: transposase [Longimicrobium sp.]|jgi:REP element-mobilizing transposase RayT
MPYYPDQHHRRSIRLRDYDYSMPGAYFVTICVEGRRCLFGQIHDATLIPNDAGHMVHYWCDEVANRFNGVRVGERVIMPNHLHAILYLGTDAVDCVGADLRVCPPSPPPRCPPDARQNPLPHPGTCADAAEGAHAGAPLPRVVQWFKTMTTNAYIRGARDHGWARFDGRLWQRNYYERVLRDDDRLARARRYVAENPVRWRDDPER